MVRGKEARVRALFVAVCGAALAACDSVQSTGHDTSELHAELEADAPGDGQVTVRVVLRPSERSRTSLDLVAPDVLTATVGKTTRTLERHSMLGSIWYDASFPVDAAGTKVKVSLSRPTSTDAPDSEVTLPAPFEFESPVENESFTRSESVPVKWNVTGERDPMLLSARGACIKPVDVQLESDTGAYTLEPFQPLAGHKKDSCVVDVHAIRSRDGSVDAAFEKGATFKSTVSRVVRITSMP
jgi:hypothetical protein